MHLFGKFCCGVLSRYASVSMWHESNRKNMNDVLGSRCCALAQSVGLFWLMKKFDGDLVLGILVFLRANEIELDVANEPNWLSFNHC